MNIHRKVLAELSLIVIASLIHGFIICPQEAFGQERRVVLHHVPPGLLIEHSGRKYMAYDLETFKEVAKVDATLTAQLKINEELQLLAVTKDRRISLLEEELRLERAKSGSLEDDLRAAEVRLKETQKLPAPPPFSERRGFWGQTEHLLVEGVLLVVIGGLIYAIADGS